MVRSRAGASAGVTTADIAVPPPEVSTPRARAVDALRGLGILVMVLGQTKPYGVLPAWMYHAQEPPPTHDVNLHLPGLTFPDLVFPFFLFTLGVAIPLSLNGRLRRGASYATVGQGALNRALLLVFLALFRNHFALVPPAVEPERTGWIVALIGVPVLFAIFTRLPATWSRWRRLPIRLAGWMAAVAMFALVKFPDGSGFSPDRFDVVLIAAAVCVVFGTAVWLATRGRLLIRLALIAVVAYFTPPYLQYLAIAIPGTIIGDAVLRWSRPSAEERIGVSGAVPWTRTRAGALAALLALFVLVVLTGIQARYVDETTAMVVVLCGVASVLARRPGRPAEAIVQQLIRWGAVWLLLGLVMDPIEGGTQKLPPTLSWMFQSVGLAIMLVAAFTIVIDILAKRWLQLLVDNGQNPMMAYVGYAMLVLPLLGLSGAKQAFESLQPAPGVAFGWGVMALLMVAFVVRFFTRRGVYWRT